MTWTDVKPCPRCGVKRRVRSDRPILCRDCRDVLSAEEADRWLVPA